MKDLKGNVELSSSNWIVEETVWKPLEKVAHVGVYGEVL